MKNQNINYRSSLLIIIDFLILFQSQSRNGSSNPDPNFELYQKCGKTFSCGGAIAKIGFPFREIDDPEYCGHPSLVLSCDGDSNATSIVIMGVKYRVMELEQNAQSMRIAREDMMRSSCPTEMVNSTLDFSVFDYAASFTNYSFTYDCDRAPLLYLNFSCGAYVYPGNTAFPDSCKATVVVPGPVMIGDEFSLNTTALEESLHRGFEIRWKVGSRICSDCIASKGRCGYVAATNEMACYCADPPYISSDFCAAANYGPPPKKSYGHIYPYYVAALGSVIAVLAVVGIGVLRFVILQRQRLKRMKQSSYLSLPLSNISCSTTTSGGNGSTVLLHSEFCRCFSFDEIKTATCNFDRNLIIGKGGFGYVYKGIIDNGATTVAIKRLNSSSNQGAHEFLTEIRMLSKLTHPHLVLLIGCCNEQEEMILVYDYMACGSLRDHLYNSNNSPLSWNVRLQICMGAAKGLNYLHTGAEHTIIHRDVKSTNILLDEEWVAKISDFGLSKMGNTNDSFTHISTDVKGTFGYLDPKYFSTRQLTRKSDVYAFGVVLFEVVSGRPAVDASLEEEQHSLAEWARHCMREGVVDRLIDPNLKGQIPADCLKTYVGIASRCIHTRPLERPTMADVVMGLELALTFQTITDSADANDQSNGVIFLDGITPIQ